MNNLDDDRRAGKSRRTLISATALAAVAGIGLPLWSAGKARADETNAYVPRLMAPISSTHTSSSRATFQPAAAQRRCSLIGSASEVALASVSTALALDSVVQAFVELMC
jgi:hypothetical protein